MLRMLFVCCDEAIPWESQLVLALKTLCGFDTTEIALRLFTSEANVHKRLSRARDIRKLPGSIESAHWTLPLPMRCVSFSGADWRHSTRLDSRC